MSKRLIVVCMLTSLAGASLCAADDPFCGKWKLNEQKSKVTGQQMKVEDLGDNRLKLTSGNETDTVLMDGTDQPIQHGLTMSISKEDSNNLRMVIKKDGKVLNSMTYSLSGDGNTQTIKGTETKPDGTTSDYNVVTKRVGQGSGWTGTWESEDVKFNSPDLIEISKFGADGLTFYMPAYKDKLSMNFDGKEYTETGPDVAAGSISSGKRTDAHTLELTNKVEGKVMDHTKYEASPDGSSMKLTVQRTGQATPQIAVFDKVQ